LPFLCLPLPVLLPIPLPFPPAIPLPLTAGSVDFALLDEDLCYECGLDTSDEANWSNLIICDGRDLNKSEFIAYSMALVFNSLFVSILLTAAATVSNLALHFIHCMSLISYSYTSHVSTACDGEYHMACVRLDRVPRNGYCCPKCYREEEEFSNLKFSVGDHFEVRLQTASNCASSSSFASPSLTALFYIAYRSRQMSTCL
jgi:hypothetical protein